MPSPRVATISGVVLRTAIFVSIPLEIVVMVSAVVLWAGIEAINARAMVAEISGVRLEPAIFAIRVIIPSIATVISGV